jgi:1,4-dihydroxy-6-naphthoate synthase
MSRTLTLGYSPCPNDTSIFYALVHGKIGTGGLAFKERLEDVETLNRLALEGALDVTKVSYGAYGALRERYCLLRSGGALGRGCGPLVVAKQPLGMGELRGKRIAIPGRMTTAFLLLQLYDPALGANAVSMPFDRIMGAVSDGSVDAGLIIHEGRFTYQNYGLTSLLDLGEWWERETGLLIPLGGIIARRDLGPELVRKVDGLVGQSVRYAMSHPAEPEEYIKRHSQEMEDDVIRAHIALYVNERSVDMGEEGVRSVYALFRMAEERGLMASSGSPLFLSSAC